MRVGLFVTCLGDTLFPSAGQAAVMADGNEYSMFIEKDKGSPVEIVYASEGSPLIVGPNAVFKNAPNPNAAKLFQSFFFSAETQQMLVDTYAHRSFHTRTPARRGVT